MVFVSVGTSTFPFERLLRRVAELGLESELVVQYGPSAFVPRAVDACEFMAYEDVVGHMRAARAVLVHGGAGSILTAFHVGRHPVVVPRRRAFREAVDDHQVEFAERLARTRLVTVVHDLADLTSELLAQARDAAPAAREPTLAHELRDFVETALAGRKTAPWS